MGVIYSELTRETLESELDERVVAALVVHKRVWVASGLEMVPGGFEWCESCELFVSDR